jgi:hypothetical protein
MFTLLVIFTIIFLCAFAFAAGYTNHIERWQKSAEYAKIRAELLAEGLLTEKEYMYPKGYSKVRTFITALFWVSGLCAAALAIVIALS